MSDPHRTAFEVEIDLSRSGSSIVRDILASAGSSVGAVAQHLVGARLQIRFEDSGVVVENRNFGFSDDLLGRFGTFLIGDTVFHVMMSPHSLVIHECFKNLVAGYRPFLIVREQDMLVAHGLAMVDDLQHQISIASIEQFVGQGLDEMGGFTRGQRGTMLRLLLETYNARVQAVETDPSLLIEIPENLS